MYLKRSLKGDGFATHGTLAELVSVGRAGARGSASHGAQAPTTADCCLPAMSVVAGRRHSTPPVNTSNTHYPTPHASKIIFKDALPTTN